MTTARTRRSTRSGACIVWVAAIALIGCTDDQRRDIRGGAVRSVMDDTTKQILDDHSIELDGSLDCEAEIADNSTVTGSCTGTTSEGDDVTSQLTGTVDPVAATCSSSLSVSVAGAVLDTAPRLDCLDD